MTNIQFRHARMIQLVSNAEWKRAQQNSDSTFVDKSIPGPPVCKLKHYDKGRGEWDIEANDYKFPAQEYQKYFCKWTKNVKTKCVRTVHVNPRLLYALSAILTTSYPKKTN